MFSLKSISEFKSGYSSKDFMRL